MRAAGAAAVLLSCFVFGLSMANSLRERAAFLRGLVRALTLLRSELCGSLLTVREALEIQAEDKSCPAHKFFALCLERMESRGFKEAWISAAAEGGDWGLDAEERAQLAALGGIIGRYEASRQQELMGQTISYFGHRAELAEKEGRQQYKLRAALGAGTGMLLTILML